MSVANEISRLFAAKALLIRKMDSAGYDAGQEYTLNELIDAIVLKSQNDWNILPDTDTWKMYNNKVPAVCGGYRFEHTFDDVWGGYYFNFTKDFIEKVQGKTVALGLSSLTGAKAKIEMVVDTKLVVSMFQTAVPKENRYTFDETVSSGYIRAVVYGADDLHCAFEGIYVKIVS